MGIKYCMISVILLQFIYYIHSRKKLYIPGVTISTRSYDIGTLPNEGGSLINVTPSILKQISENDDIEKNDAYENYYKIILPTLLDRIKYFPKVLLSLLSKCFILVLLLCDLLS